MSDDPAADAPKGPTGRAAGRPAEATDEDGSTAGTATDVQPSPDRPRHDLGVPGKPLERHSAFYIGFFGGLGALLAYWLGTQLLAISSVLILVVVAMFLAAGLNPVVEFFIQRGLRRSYAVLAVIVMVVIALGAVRARHRPGDQRPGRRHHRERPRVVRRAPAQPADPGPQPEVRPVRPGGVLHRAGRVHQQPVRRRPRGRAGGALHSAQRVHRRGADALLPVLPAVHQDRPLPPGPALPPGPGHQARRPGARQHRWLRLGRLHRGHLRRPQLADLPVRRGPRGVRRGAGLRGRPARRDPDDRRHHRGRDRERHRFRGRTSRSASPA